MSPIKTAASKKTTNKKTSVQNQRKKRLALQTRVDANILKISGHGIAPGTRKTIDVLAAKLYTHEPVYMPVHVINGREPGPKLFITAALHGNELNGIEIVKRVLQRKNWNKLKGTIIAVPIVNVLGVFHQSRYLPDRRDLNRHFPGLERGSLASRIAHLVTQEIISNATHGIDLHTASNHRDNWPQIRTIVNNKQSQQMAKFFNAPITLDAPCREGSLRQAASDFGIPTVVYEAGEALRFNDKAIRIGVEGVFNVMRGLNMLPEPPKARRKSYIARTSRWVRAPSSGIVRTDIKLGERVKKKQVIATVSDPFGEDERPVLANISGVVIGRSRLPLVHEGEALFHIGKTIKPKKGESGIEHPEIFS